MPQQATADAGREWAASWSHRVGRAIAHHRKAAGLTAQQLSERCAELGYPISRSAIAGMESARKDAIIVAEVQVIARAIGVTPLRLLFPLGREQTTEALPGADLPTWLEIRWWQGEHGQPYRLPSGEWVADDMSMESTFKLFHAHELEVRWVENVRAKLRDHVGQGTQDDEEREYLRNSEEHFLDSLRRVRALMRAHGLLLPVLPEGFLPDDVVDERPQPKVDRDA